LLEEGSILEYRVVPRIAGNTKYRVVPRIAGNTKYRVVPRIAGNTKYCSSNLIVYFLRGPKPSQAKPKF